MKRFHVHILVDNLAESVAVEGSDEQKRAAFVKIFKQIMARMNSFVSLPVPMLDKHAIQQEMKKIGDTPVANA
jgi:arsenate reductase